MTCSGHGPLVNTYSELAKDALRGRCLTRAGQAANSSCQSVDKELTRCRPCVDKGGCLLSRMRAKQPPRNMSFIVKCGCTRWQGPWSVRRSFATCVNRSVASQWWGRHADAHHVTTSCGPRLVRHHVLGTIEERDVRVPSLTTC